jgi:hypothetical protein
MAHEDHELRLEYWELRRAARRAPASTGRPACGRRGPSAARHAPHGRRRCRHYAGGSGGSAQARSGQPPSGPTAAGTARRSSPRDTPSTRYSWETGRRVLSAALASAILPGQRAFSQSAPASLHYCNGGLRLRCGWRRPPTMSLGCAEMQGGRLAASPLARKFLLCQCCTGWFQCRGRRPVLLGGRTVGSKPISPCPWLGRRR